MKILSSISALPKLSSFIYRGPEGGREVFNISAADEIALNETDKAKLEEFQTYFNKNYVFTKAQAALQDKGGEFRKTLNSRGTFKKSLRNFDRSPVMDTDADGYYGNSTRLAVAYFQFEKFGPNPNKVDGALGPETISLMSLDNLKEEVKVNKPKEVSPKKEEEGAPAEKKEEAPMKEGEEVPAGKDTEVKKENTELRGQVKKLEGDLKQSEAEVAKLEELLTTEKDEKGVLKTQLDEAKSQLGAAQKKIDALSKNETEEMVDPKDVKGAEESLREANQQIEDIKKQLEASKKTNEELGLVIESQAEKIQVLEEKVKELESRVKESEGTEEEMEGLNKTIKELRAELKATKDEVASMKAAKEGDVTQEDIENAAKSLEAVNEMAEGLQEKLNESQKEKEAAEQKAADLKASLEEALKNNEELGSIIEEQASENDAFKKQLAASKENGKEMDGGSENTEAVGKELEAALAKIKELEAAQVDMVPFGDHQKVRQEVVELKNEVTRTQDKVKEAEKIAEARLESMNQSGEAITKFLNKSLPENEQIRGFVPPSYLIKELGKHGGAEALNKQIAALTEERDQLRKEKEAAEATLEDLMETPEKFE